LSRVAQQRNGVALNVLLVASTATTSTQGLDHVELVILPKNKLLLLLYSYKQQCDIRNRYSAVGAFRRVCSKVTGRHVPDTETRWTASCPFQIVFP
jgi:hypothetical protein